MNSNLSNESDLAGNPSVYSCSECGGVLWKIRDGNLSRWADCHKILSNVIVLGPDLYQDVIKCMNMSLTMCSIVVLYSINCSVYLLVL